MKFRIIITAMLCTAVAAFAQLSMSKADWARGPVQFLMTSDEQNAWKAIKSDAEADQFIALFWAKRGPAVQQAFDSRVQYADQQFSTPRQRGALSDRGKVLILFGAPTQPVRVARPAAANPTMTPTTGTAAGAEADETSGETQTWIYDGDRAEKLFNSPKVEFRFVDRMNNHDFRMDRTRIDFAAAQQRAANAAITNPNLTTVPAQQPPKPAPQPAAAVAPPSPSTNLRTAAFETAAADAQAGKTASKGALISYAEWISPTGDYYVPVALYVPGSAGLTADSADTVFGVVEDSTGKRVLVFEEPAKLTASISDYFVDKTLELPSGKYSVTLGLGKAGAPVVVASAPLELKALTKESTGTSRLLLSNNIYDLPEAVPVKSPFAFGKEKIVPKADLVFSNKDNLHYFVEVHNPGLTDVPLNTIPTLPQPPAATGAAANAQTTVRFPKLQMKIELVDSSGTTIAGNPLSDVPVLPLSGQPGPGEYAIIDTIPLGQLKTQLAPGNYALKIKIVDTISKQSYNLEQKFKIKV